MLCPDPNPTLCGSDNKIAAYLKSVGKEGIRHFIGFNGFQERPEIRFIIFLFKPFVVLLMDLTRDICRLA